MAKRKLLFGDQSIGEQLGAPSVMPLAHYQAALKQAMSSQTNNEQILPKSDPQNLDSAGISSPSESKPKLSQKLFGYDEPNSHPLDEYGLERPKVHHEGILSKIAGIGLPALVGLAGGAGVGPGLLTGFLGERGREAALNKQETQAYNKARADAYQADKLQQEMDLKGRSLDETIRGHNLENARDLAKIGIEKEKLTKAGDDYDLNKIYVKSAVPKLVNKQSILNTLKSTLSEYNSALQKGDNEQAYILGQRALKTINSPEGADAIGKEESERLGSQLKMFRQPFAIPGDIGVGRKLPEFGQSLQDTIDVLEGSVGQGVSQIKNPASVFNNQSQRPNVRKTKSGLQYEVE